MFQLYKMWIAKVNCCLKGGCCVIIHIYYSSKFMDNSQETNILEKMGRFVWEIVKVVVVSLAIVIPIRYFLIQPFFVKGASMEPNFEDGEYLIIDEISYNLGKPRRGEVVVFRYPRDPSQYYIKRIVGLPEERVVVSGGRVMIYNWRYPQGFVLDEKKYLYSLRSTPGEVNIVLGNDEYFVLGDNRPGSSDSRIFGAVPAKNIIGRAWVRAWPFNRMTKFDVPTFAQDLQ